MRTFLIIVSLAIITIIIIVAINNIFKIVFKHINNIHLKYINSTLNVIVVTIAILSCLSQFEITRELGNSLFKGSGLILAIVTFAAQKTLGNIISGMSISISKPFEIGQKIKVMSGTSIIAEGYVQDITVRHTIIKQYDGQCCIIPNSITDSSVIINTNYEENVGNYLEIEIGYNSDITLAKEKFLEICKNNTKLINKDSMTVLISRFTSNGLVLKTTIWTQTLQDNFTASTEIRQQLVEEFKKFNIDIPYQTITLNSIKE